LSYCLLSLLSISPALSKLSCQTPVVCDPSLESDIYIKDAHYRTEAECEDSCSIGHPYNPCKFFTWVPNAQAQVPNCYHMKACNEMSDPITGSQSGAWSCDDEKIFCSSIGDVPPYDDKKTVWTCDHNVHAYGTASNIFQDTTCRTTCPSFEFISEGKNTKADIVVSSTCVYDSNTETSIWSTPSPDNVQDSSGVAVGSASDTPTPGCGCKDLVLPGIIAEEAGKVFKCTIEDIVDGDNTVITQDNNCALLCDGNLVFDLFCSVGQWSVDYLQTAADIYCYGGGSTNANQYDYLSTFWPTVPPTGNPNPTDPPTEPTTEATEPTTEVTEPTTAPTEPTTAPTEEPTTLP